MSIRQSGDPEDGCASPLRDLLERGSSLFKNGEYEQSQKVFEEAVAKHPRSAEAHAWLAAVYGRLIETVWSITDKMTLLAKLDNEVDTALELDPTLPLARRMNGARLLNKPDMLGGDPSAAADEFRYCIDRGVNDAEIWVSLAECFLKTEEKAKAAEALETALAREPGYERADLLLQRMKSGEDGERP